MLDPKGIESPILDEIFNSNEKDNWPAKTVEQWIIEDLNYQESVNFPASGFTNYKNLILEPHHNNILKATPPTK